MERQIKQTTIEKVLRFNCVFIESSGRKDIYYMDSAKRILEECDRKTGEFQTISDWERHVPSGSIVAVVYCEQKYSGDSSSTRLTPQEYFEAGQPQEIKFRLTKTLEVEERK